MNNAQRKRKNRTVGRDWAGCPWMIPAAACLMLALTGCSSTRLELGVGELSTTGQLKFNAFRCPTSAQAGEEAGRPVEGCSLAVVLSAEGGDESESVLKTDARGQATLAVLPFAQEWLGSDVAVTASHIAGSKAEERVHCRFDALALLQAVHHALDPARFGALVQKRKKQVFRLMKDELSPLRNPFLRINRLALFCDMLDHDLKPEILVAALNHANPSMQKVAFKIMSGLSEQALDRTFLMIQHQLPGDYLDVFAGALQGPYGNLRKALLGRVARQSDQAALALLAKLDSSGADWYIQFMAGMLQKPGQEVRNAALAKLNGMDHGSLHKVLTNVQKEAPARLPDVLAALIHKPDVILKVMAGLDADLADRTFSVIKKDHAAAFPDVLVRSLQGTSASLRKAALGRIGGLSDEAALALLDDVKGNAADWYVELVAGMLQRPGRDIRKSALSRLNSMDESAVSDVLAVIREGSPGLLPGVLEAALREPAVSLRKTVLSELSHLDDDTRLRLLKTALKDVHPDIRDMAARKLNSLDWERAGRLEGRIAAGSGLDPKAVADATRDGYHWIRLRAVEALPRLPEDQAVPLLIKALSDAHPYVRSVAARTLSACKDKRAVEALKKMAREDLYIGARLAADGALKKMGE